MTTQQAALQQRPVAYRILNLKTVIERTGLSRSTIYDISNPKSKRYDATFPERIHLSTNRVGWVEQEINDWLASKIQQRGDAEVNKQQDNVVAS